MSGYLQRITAIALSPKGRAHPFVEPMFGTASQRVSEMASSDATPRVQATSADASLAHPALHVRIAKNGASEPQRQASRREIYEPLMAEASGEALGSDPRSEFMGRAEPVVRPPAIRDTDAKNEASGLRQWGRQRDDEAEMMDWKFEPLMRETVRETSGSESFAHRTRNAEAVPNETAGLRHAAQDIKSGRGEAFGASVLLNAAEVAAARRLAQQQPARAQAEQQRDEIQIHIGRIEVTAIPPAAPRPMPAPVRKTQTLDEYLRRSSGRA